MSRGRRVPPPPPDVFEPATPVNPSPAELAAAMRPGLHMLAVAHDSWCPQLRGGVCACNPDVQLLRFAPKGGRG